jgi:transmembrane sensor
MPSYNSSRSKQSSIEEAAALWLARRDRGLNAAEQDEFLQWIREDPCRADAFERHEKTLRRVMQLTDWRPVRSPEPNPDLLAPPNGRHQRWVTGMAAAAILALGLVAWWRTSSQDRVKTTTKSYLLVNERRVLSDGSVVELKENSRLSVEFSSTERRVHLEAGEAHFDVTKNVNRPFIVDAEGIAVRAVGTAFDVRIDSDSVDVLVTEGKVRVQQPNVAGGQRPGVSESPLVVAMHEAVISRDPAAQAQRLTAVTPDQVNDALSWTMPRLEFNETPLVDAVSEFNRRNQRQLVLEDSKLESMRIGGVFRTNDVDGFVRLLELTLGVRAESVGTDRVVLFLPK